MGRIRFHFDLDKAIQVMAYVANELDGVDKVKLTKLLYIAEREHFLQHGNPIMGDDLFAMRYGPVPSQCLDELAEGFERGDAREYLHIDDYRITCRKPPNIDALEDTEKAILDRVLSEHGQRDSWQLVAETHEFPEYKRKYQQNTSTLIPYELILEIYGQGHPELFRLDRPVVRRQSAARMNCPFPKSEPDL